MSTVLMNPATPAAALVWPRLLFTAPSQIGPGTGPKAGPGTPGWSSIAALPT